MWDRKMRSGPGKWFHWPTPCSLFFFSGSLACPWALTLVNVIATKVGPIRVVSQEVSQEGGEVVAVSQHQVGAQHVLVHEAQVEVIAERVHVHQVPHLVTLLREQHGQLRGRQGLGQEMLAQGAQHRLPAHSRFPPLAWKKLKIHPVAVGPSARAALGSPPRYVVFFILYYNPVYMKLTI